MSCRSWSPNPNWPEFYAEADEIRRYYRGLAEKCVSSSCFSLNFGLKSCGRFDLLKYIHLEHEVIHAEWDGQAHRWRLQVRRPDQTVFEDDCDVFINAGGAYLSLPSWSNACSNGGIGVLNAWKWPDIKGLHDFEGTLCHTARWPKDLDHKGTSPRSRSRSSPPSPHVQTRYGIQAKPLPSSAQAPPAFSSSPPSSPKSSRSITGFVAQHGLRARSLRSTLDLAGRTLNVRGSLPLLGIRRCPLLFATLVSVIPLMLMVGCCTTCS